MGEQEYKMALAWEREQGLGKPVSASNRDAFGNFNGVRSETYDYEFRVSVPLDETVVPAYLEAVKFTNGGPDHPDIEEAEFTDTARNIARLECGAFIDSHLDAVVQAVNRVGYSWRLFAHDLWMTRNHHGAGFWDRPELREDGLGAGLAALARAMREQHTLLDADGHICFA